MTVAGSPVGEGALDGRLFESCKKCIIMTDPCSSFRIEFIWQKPEKAGRFVSILRSSEAAAR